ncbi:hypothetical protein P4S72_18710 [Vibrio sp. PP-XX7]
MNPILKGITYSILFILAGCSHKEHPLVKNQTMPPVFINPSLTVNYRLTDTSNIHNLTDQFTAVWSDDMTFMVEPTTINTERKQKEFKINSCKSMLFAYQEKYELTYMPSYGIYHAVYSECKAISLIINKMAQPVYSYIKGFQLNQNTIKNLPKDMALVTSTSRYNDVHADPTITTLEDVNHIVKVMQQNEFSATAEDDGGGIQDITILARGDFNNDQIEDLLFSVSNSVVGGSYTSYYLYVLTKTKKDGDWVVLAEYPQS